MPCPHFDVKIIQRSKRQSAVASAAYQSGERLFSEYDQKQKYYSHKSEIVHTEIMLPPHAPPEYADRNTLWNAAEAIEKQWNSQLARRFVLAIPRELPRSQYADLIRDYCREFFVSKGMIADFAIHDKGDGNPHAHILLTMRAMDEQGKWLPKSRKVYDLDENGERTVIKDILMNPVYTGAIASQKKEYRFKIGTIGEKKPEEWIVVENQHEPLVDRKTFDIVQRKLKSRQRPRQTGEISLFAGLIKCGECGKSLTIRYTNEKHPKQIYSCKTYNAYGKQHCSQHRVEYDTLYRLVLNKIRECARAALMDGEAVAGKLSDTCEAEQKGQREALERSLAKDEERIDVLEKMVLRLYEDMVAGRISEANFNLLMEKTQKEQAELKARVEEGRKKLADEIRLAYDARQWVEAIQEYADITELDAATLNRLIKEIVVHESIDSDKTRHISIEIHFNLKPLPEVEQVTA